MPPSPPITPDPLLGTGYQTLSPLAVSPTSEVVDAHHPRRGRVVVKLLQAYHQDRPDLIRRMAREAAVLERLRDPRIVRFLDFGVTDSQRPFLVMERLFGSTFSEEVGARGRLPVPEAIALVAEVLAGLEIAHAFGVVHRDIKPSNLMVCFRPNAPPAVKILDFGIARIQQASPLLDETLPYEALTEPHTLVGTPRYASPEQVRGQLVDVRTDVYSAGLVLYFLLAGRGPWDDQTNAADAMRAQIFLPPPPLWSFGVPLGAQLEQVVARALAKSPEERFPTARAFHEALCHAAREPLPMPARLVPLLPSPPSHTPPRPLAGDTETTWPPRRAAR
jgi:serine/threonine protein kinase